MENCHVDNDNDNDDYDHDDDHGQYHDHESIFANLHRLNSTVNTTAAVKGRGVDRALWGGLILILILILAYDSSRIMIVDMILSFEENMAETAILWKPVCAV